MAVTVVQHPLAHHLLTVLRDRETGSLAFRQASKALATILILEATRSMPTEIMTVETPIQATEQPVLGQGLAVIPILRAGLGMLESTLELFPDVAVGYIGLERDEVTARPASYYCKLPSLAGRYTVCVDPMLATGGSAITALSMCKERGANPLLYCCVIAAPEGIDAVEAAHPDVPIIACAVDECLNDKSYIVPGLGDFGDRLFGTG